MLFFSTTFMNYNLELKIFVLKQFVSLRKKNITEKVNQLKFRCQLREWCNLTNGEEECFNFYYKFSLFFVAALFYVQYFGSVRTYYLSNKHLKKQLDCGQNLLAYSLRLMVNAKTLIFNKISCERLIIYSYEDKMSKYKKMQKQRF